MLSTKAELYKNLQFPKKNDLKKKEMFMYKKKPL